MLIVRTLLVDFAIAGWVSGCTLLLLYWLPRRSYFAPNQSLPSTLLVGSLTRTLLGLTLMVSVLAHLGLFNWLTAVLGYIGALFATWYGRVRHRVWQQLLSLYESCFFGIFDALDHGLSWRKAWDSVTRQWPVKRLAPWLISREASPVLLYLVSVVVLSFALLVRYEHPLLELRFTRVEYYQTLLTTRQLISGDWPQAPFSVVACGAAVLSLITAVDPMQVLRFLGPLVGLLLVALVGQFTWMLTWQRGAALAAAFSLGIYCFTGSITLQPGPADSFLPLLRTLVEQLNLGLVRQWSPGNPEVGALCLLLTWLSLLSLNTTQQQSHRWVNFLSGMGMVAIAAPDMLPLQVLGSLGILINLRLGLALIGGGWLFLATLAAAYPGFAYGQSLLITLPVGLSLLIGGIFAFLHDGLQTLKRKAVIESISLVTAFALIINFALPIDAAIAYLEHDAAARAAIGLNDRYPSKRWMIVAPIEQLSETYGDGWYEDLASFVEKYGVAVNQPDFIFPVNVPDLFVFVEKQPFKTFAIEPLVVSGTAAFDPVYRNYRSLAGRASLQFDALDICEKYRRHHTGSDIYYEDDALRIYHFLIPVETAEAMSNE